ncbi:MAG: PspC domain-containing protein [Lacisediminihabitans sp.]
MATKTTPPPQPTAPSPAPHSKNFFDWMRALNLPRRHGWLGGVCAGIAERMGIDPLIVRGIAVVIAVLGGPAILLYAAAWLLLPDSNDTIHLERLIKGEFDAAHIGVAALVVLSLLPMAQGFWFLGASYWAGPDWSSSIGRALWTVVLITAGVLITVWLARRARNSSADPTVVPATTDARPDTVPEPSTGSVAELVEAPATNPSTGSGNVGAGTVAELGATPPVPNDSENRSAVPVGSEAPQPPAPLAAGAPAEDLAAWREQQSQWKTEHDAWKRQQAASVKELRDQQAAERHTRAVANAAAANERRRLRRLANPRVSGSQVVITLGAALLVGGIAAIVSQSGTGWSGYGVTVGLAAATITVALSALIAGLFRRRSGFLGFVALLLVTSTVVVSFIPPDRTLAGVNSGAALESGGRYAQLVGRFDIYFSNDTSLDTSNALDLWQGAGSTSIDFPRGTTVRIEANLGEPTLSLNKYIKAKDDEWDVVAVNIPRTKDADGRYRYTFTVGSGTPTTTVRIWQGTGSITVNQQPPLGAATPDSTNTAPTNPESGVNQ